MNIDSYAPRGIRPVQAMYDHTKIKVQNALDELAKEKNIVHGLFLDKKNKIYVAKVGSKKGQQHPLVDISKRKGGPIIISWDNKEYTRIKWGKP